MFSIDELTKKVEIELPEDISKKERDELLEEIGDYIKVTMLDMIGEGRSPVTGRKWKSLSPDYAKFKGTKLANMDLEGDLLDALEIDVKKGNLYVGWWDDSQAPKAYGHTTGMEGHPWLEGKVPVRKLIPDDKENFSKEIREGISTIIKEWIDANQD